MVITKTADTYLAEALDALRKDQAAWEAQKERERLEFSSRIRAIQDIVGATGTRSDVSTAQAPTRAPAEGPILSIGDDKLQRMKDYLEQRSKARQADIAAELGLNSGTVSVGLRRLQIDGVARSNGREGGSRVWEFVKSRVAA